MEAARGALNWGTTAAHNRAQILYFLGENLEYRADEFARRIRAQTGESLASAQKEVAASVERLFAFAGWADKYDGAVHNPPSRTIAIAMVEPIGVMGILAPPSRPLLGSIALLAPAIAMGNPVVLVPSETAPLSVTDLYQVIETSDLPAGSVNIVTGDSVELAAVLAKHDDVDALWCVGETQLCATVERESAANLKRVWTSGGLAPDWAGDAALLDDFFRRAVEIKNVWVPYGD